MKITPIEIRQKTFEKHFRGYDKDEVTSFLGTLSQEWEKLMDEKRDLQVKLENSEKEGSKLKEVESSLYKTLKTAEDTGANIIEQATSTADQIIKEAQTDAQLLQRDAKQRSQDMIETAENKAKEIMGNLKNDLQELIKNYESLLQQREKLVSNLHRLAGNALSSVEDAEKSFDNIDIHSHAKQLEDLSEGSALEKLVEEKFHHVGTELNAESKKEEKPSSSDVIIIDHTTKAEERGDHIGIKSSEINSDETLSVDEQAVQEEEKEAAIKEAEKQFKVHEPKPSYFDERPKSAIEKEALENKKQSGSFFDQFE